ncbi:PASTA domain-containing protein [candidate division KSB1 bacterium]|nr:MAG: PASTA domain-containing protein [candidate division KSB1 bacterium]
MSKLNRIKGRERALAVLLFFFITAFTVRLVQLQVFQHSQWRTLARNQSLVSKFQKPTRGEIRDCNGMALAVTLPLTYAIGYRPCYAIDFDNLAGTLATQLTKARREIRERLVTGGFSYLARRVDWQTKQKIENLHYNCFQFDEEPRRSYPSGTSAAVIIGFTNVDGMGMEGVEAAMNDELSGEGYRELCRVDALRKSAAPISPQPIEFRGANVTLTLDLQIQTILEDKLREGLRGKAFERACAIAVNPRTGDLLGLATSPSYDLNAPGDARTQDRRCWPVTDVVEPGSVLKIVPIAKALESRKLTRSSRIFCENGSYAVPGAIIHDTHRHGSLTLDEVLAFSSNIGAVKVCQQFSREEIYDKLRDFGFGNKTTIEIAGEQAGEIPQPSRWSGSTQATLAYGQGISCTPLQLTMAYASIANGGLLLKPRLVRAVDFPSGTHTEYPAEVIRRVVPEDVAANLADMLAGVVTYGTGTTVQVDAIRIAGKTGTAEKVDHVRKTYYKDRYISSFVGFFPVDNPRYVLLIMIDDPRGEYYGATVAGPIFKSVVEELLLARPQEMTPLRPEQMAANRAAVRNNPAEAVFAVNHTTPKPTTVLSSSRAAQSSDSLVIMPSLEGWPFRLAIQELSLRNLSFRLTGNRTVVSQYPPAGTPVSAGTTCELHGITG